MKKSIAIVFLLIAFSTINVMAQTDEVMTNDKVVGLYKKGLSTSIIVSKIKASKSNYDVSTDALISLKDQKIPDDIVNAMVEASGSAGSSKKSNDGEPVYGDVNDPNAAHESGIYYDKKSGSKDEMTLMEPTICSSTSSGSGWGYGYGGSVRRKATIDGGMARIQIEESKPTFYFYFSKTTQDLSNTGWAGWNSQSTSPSEFVLLKIIDKPKVREFTIGSSNAYSGNSSGFDPKQRVEFTFEKVKPGVYKVTPKSPLIGAEYCFIYAGSTQGVTKVYDFGIR